MFAILGRPRVTLNVAADAPLADWFVRLSDVAPDGRVTLVTGAGSTARSASHGGADGLGTWQGLSPVCWTCILRPGCSPRVTESASRCRMLYGP